MSWLRKIHIQAKKISFTSKEAKAVSKRIGIKWNQVDFSLEEFRMGLEVEVEHGPCGPDKGEALVTGDSDEAYGLIAWAHLKEIPDYYTRLGKMEEEGKKALSKKK